jgi:hypothetical protein
MLFRLTYDGFMASYRDGTSALKQTPIHPRKRQITVRKHVFRQKNKEGNQGEAMGRHR